MLRNTYRCSEILSEDFFTIFNDWISYYNKNLNENDPNSVKTYETNVTLITQSYESGNQTDFISNYVYSYYEEYYPFM